MNYTIRHSKRAKRAKIRIAQGRVEVVLPKRAGALRVPDILRQNSGWVLKQLLKIDRRREQEARNPFPPTGSIIYRGAAVPVNIMVAAASDSRPEVSESHSAIVLRIPAESGIEPREVLEKWLRDRAKSLIAAGVTTRAEQMGATYRSISVRDQRTRWGGCSRLKNLTFSWRLIMAPPAVMDYIIVHELAHLFELNHSMRFWAIVGRFCPDFASHRRWLREHQSLLEIPAAIGRKPAEDHTQKRRWVEARLPF